jgi:hypothetical protein
MPSKLIPELVCQQCLRDFSKYNHLEQAENIRLSRPGLLRHQRTCSLRYSNPIPGQVNPIVYCIAPDAPMDERRRAFHTATTMHISDEVPGDLIGWCPIREREVYAFLPVSNGQVTGFVIVRKRVAVATKRSPEAWVPVENSSAHIGVLIRSGSTTHIDARVLHPAPSEPSPGTSKKVPRT